MLRAYWVLYDCASAFLDFSDSLISLMRCYVVISISEILFVCCSLMSALELCPEVGCVTSCGSLISCKAFLEFLEPLFAPEWRRPYALTSWPYSAAG